jgi:flagellar hook-associated protein 3 FlgL
MAIRTPDPTMSKNLLLDLQRTNTRISTLTEQIASGLRINNPGDDPTGSAMILDFQTSIDQNTAYLKQADSALSFLSATEVGTQSVTNSMERLMEIAQQGLSGTAASNAALVPEVDGIHSSLVSIGNTQDQGKYIFSGTATLTLPFTGPAAGPIAYGGDAGLINLQVSSSSTVTTNIVGSTLFLGPGGQGSSTDIFQVVSDLSNALSTNNSAQIQTAYNNLQGIFDRVLQTTADLGGRQANLNDLKSTLGDVNLGLQSVLNNEAQIDYPTAATDLSTAQTAQQATLSVIAKASQQKNLFDYLA